MRVIDEQPMETIHLYVVLEDQLPPKRDYFAIFTIIFCSLLLLNFIFLCLLAPSPNHEVSFSLAVQGYALAPVTKTMNRAVHATGKHYVPATTATGTITFYNGAIYTQIIPINTVLKGADGIPVITDAQATIPPTAQTIPPTYGRTSVLAHSVTPGMSGNVEAGDINQACCVTSVIAQNPYGFHGGRNAYTDTYLTGGDVKNATASLLPTLQAQTLSLFHTLIVLDPHCSTTVATHPFVGQQTSSAIAKISTTCNTVSYAKNPLLHLSLHILRILEWELSLISSFKLLGWKVMLSVCT